MSDRRSRSGGFLCFTIAQPDDEDETEAEARGGDDRLPRRRLHLRILSKIVRPTSLFPFLNRSRKERKRKGFDPSKRERESAHDDGWRTDSSTSSTYSVSASSLSSSSSNSSSSSARLSMAALADRAEPNPPRRRSMTKASAAGIFMLLSSLSIMVFCGRLSAIVWTSWLLFVSCGYSVSEQVSAVAGKEAAERPMSPGARRRRSVEAAEEKKRVILKGLLARNKKV